MIGRFWFYRRRRTLPFMAVACLVFINGATLAPLAVPPGLAVGSAASPDDTAAGPPDWHHYERDDGCGQEPVVAAAVPPIVKNLRRPAPSRTLKAVVRGHERQPADAPGPTPELLQRVLAANAADLTRLCRLLL